MADLAVRGGIIVSARQSFQANLLVSDGRIADVGSGLQDASETIDATGLLVLPGLVDTHVHLMDPGDTSREDFPTGTAAAAAAGVTTLIEHTHARPIRSASDLAEKTSYLKGRSHVDYGLAAHVWPDRIDGLAELWSAGVSFFKIFTCSTHGVPGLGATVLERALTAIAGFDGSCLVHCEDDTMTGSAESSLRSAGRSDNGVLVEWRSRVAEQMAVDQVCELAVKTGVRGTIAHVSNPAVAAIVDSARSRGADIVAETCPQYFGLREDEVLVEGPLRKFTPPARARSDEEEDEMWALLRSGAFNHISTDHAPSTRAQKDVGIWEAPFGLPGLDTTGPFLIDAVSRGKISFPDIVRVYSEAPARRYGLYPRKGQLSVGSDADFVLIDPARKWRVGDGDIISKAGWSPFAEKVFTGSVVATYLRGRLVAQNRQPTNAGSGEFIPGPGAQAL